MVNSMASAAQDEKFLNMLGENGLNNLEPTGERGGERGSKVVMDVDLLAQLCL